MINSAYQDQLASLEVNGSWSIPFAKAGHIRVQQDQGLNWLEALCIMENWINENYE